MSQALDWTDLEQQLGVERRRVDVASHDFSVRELVRMLNEGELSITPEYQRQYRWKPAVASTFIESVFLGLPIPPIFVATNAGYELEVVDGLQRLSSLLFFLREGAQTLEKDDHHAAEPLKLEGLQKLTQLNGVGFADLPVGLQRYFGRQPLQVISLTDKSDRGMRFDLFERLNAGSIALSPQEVRACVYRGRFNQFIEELAALPDYGRLLKLQDAKQKDGTAVEEVLKFFAYKNSVGGFDGRVKTFLNDYMKSAQDEHFDYTRERTLFTSAVAHLLAATNDGPLLRASTGVTPLVQLEACLVGIGSLISEGQAVTTPVADWQEDPELVDSSTGGSNTRSKLQRRIARAKVLFSANA